MADAVKVVREALGAFNRAEWDRLDEFVHPDFELVSPLADARGAPYEGTEGAEEWVKEVSQNFAGFATSLESLTEVAPGRVLGTGRAQVAGRASGLDYEQEIGVVCDVRDGRVAKVWIFFDRDEAEREAKRLDAG